MEVSVSGITVNFSAETVMQSGVEGADLWLNILDYSQLIMTIIGIIANAGTSITLYKSKQVSDIFYPCN